MKRYLKDSTKCTLVQHPLRKASTSTSRANARTFFRYAISLLAGLYLLLTGSESGIFERTQLRRSTASTTTSTTAEEKGSRAFSTDDQQQEEQRELHTFFDRVIELQFIHENLGIDIDEDYETNDQGGKDTAHEEGEEGEVEEEGSSSSSITTATTTRPKMYTFFHRIDENKRWTGMTDDGDDEMLALWQEEWTAAGFDTYILTLDDAMSHPQFAEFEEKLEDVPLNTPTKIYNRMCFIRHLAMAAVGGGYMSDYDVLPLIHQHSTSRPPPSLADQHDTPPVDWVMQLNTEQGGVAPLIDFSNDEDIQVYSATAAGGGIPCLMSGSASKWETLAFQLLENGLKHRDARMWTDFLAMIDIQSESENENLYVVNDVVLKKFDASNPEWSQDSCARISRFAAIHFSHHTLKEHGMSVDQRAEIAKKWLHDWRLSCYTS